MEQLQRSFYVMDDEEWRRSVCDNVVIDGGATLQTVEQVHFFQEKHIPPTMDWSLLYVDHCQLFLLNDQLQQLEWHHTLPERQSLPWDVHTMKQFVVMERFIAVQQTDEALVLYERQTQQVVRRYKWEGERLLHSQVVDNRLVVWTGYERTITMRTIAVNGGERVEWRWQVEHLFRTVYCSAYEQEGHLIGTIYFPANKTLYTSRQETKVWDEHVQSVTTLNEQQSLVVVHRERETVVQLHDGENVPEVVYRSSSRTVRIQRHLAYTFIIDEAARNVLGGTWQTVTRRTMAGARGTVTIGPFDCQREGHQWQQLRWKGVVPAMCHVKVTCAASDEATFERANVVTFHDGTVYHLAALKGRYVTVTFELQGTRVATPHVQHVQLTYEKRDLFVHLPAFFREDVERTHFLPRFLTLMQSFIDDIDEHVDEMRRNLRQQDGLWQQLRWQPDWFRAPQDVEPFLPELIWRRGTKAALQVAVQLYVERAPLIVEMNRFTNVEQADVQRRLWTTLIGVNEQVTWLFVDVEPERLHDVRQTIQRVIAPFIPSYTTVQIVFLERAIRLDQHCYLGINSYLTAYYPLELVAHATLPSYGQLPERGEETILGDDMQLGPSFTLV